MESSKSVIWRKEDLNVNNKKLYKYLIGTILVTDQPIIGLVSQTGDNVAIGGASSTNLNALTNAYSTLPKYNPPHILGDLSDAMLSISDLTSNDLNQNHD